MIGIKVYYILTVFTCIFIVNFCIIFIKCCFEDYFYVDGNFNRFVVNKRVGMNVNCILFCYLKFYM